MSTTNQSCNCKSAKCFQIATIVLLVAAIASSIWAGCQITKMETLKVGGKENFAKLQEIMKSDEYKEQYSQSLDLMLQQLNGTYADDMFGGEEIIIDEPVLDESSTGEEAEIIVNPSTDEVTIDDTINVMDQNESAGE